MVKSNYTDAHKHMMRNVFLNVELDLNDEVNEIAEYDIQYRIFQYFKIRQNRYNIINATREQENRTDIIVNLVGGEKAYIEAKSYFKEHEKIRKRDIDHDIKKLYLKAITPNTCTYFIIAGLREKFSLDQIEEFEFIKLKVEDKKSKKNSIYEIDFAGETKSVTVRPSICESKGRSYLWSWEIIAIQ